MLKLLACDIVKLKIANYYLDSTHIFVMSSTKKTLLKCRDLETEEKSVFRLSLNGFFVGKNFNNLD